METRFFWPPEIPVAVAVACHGIRVGWISKEQGEEEEQEEGHRNAPLFPGLPTILDRMEAMPSLCSTASTMGMASRTDLQHRQTTDQ